MKPDLPLYNKSSNSADENSDIKKLLMDFFSIWPWVLLLVSINLLIAIFLSKTTTPTYQVQASMVIKQDKNSVSEELFESVGLKPANNIENEIAILNSFTLAYNTIKELDFNVEYFQEGIWKKKEIYKGLPCKLEIDWNHRQILDGEVEIKLLGSTSYQLSIKERAFRLFSPEAPDQKLPVGDVSKVEGKYRLNEWVSGPDYKFRLVRTEIPFGKVNAFSFRLRSNYFLAAEYSKRLKVSVPKKESTILTLTLETSMVEKGKEYLNKVIEVYQERELTNKNRTATNTANFINQQLKSIKDSLVYFEDRLENYRSRNQSFNLEQQSSLVLNRLAALEEQRANTSLKIKYYQNILSYLNKEQIDQLTVPSAAGIEEPVIGQLINELIAIQNDRARLNQFLSGENKTLRDLNFRYTSVLNTLRESISRSYKTANLSLADLNRRINELNANLNSMPQVERDLLSLKRQSSISENIYTYLLQKRDEAEISKASNVPSSEVLDLSRQIGGMITPTPVRNYAIALSLGVLLPLLFLFLRNMFNNRIYDPKALERRLAVPLLGTIGRSQRKGGNTVVADAPKSFVAENFRSIRASTQFLHPADKSMVVAFTSSVSNEGKTFCSINTATIYAFGEKKVILVGLDLRRPKIADDFGLKNEIGVSNYLSGKGDYKELIQPSGIENLDILLSGPIPPNPAELIGNNRFAELISALRTDYDVVILDCPPAGLVSETIDIFNHSDLNFYIFRHMFSDWNAVDHLNDLIEKGLIKKAYAVYNDMVVPSAYGYGYGYHYHADDVQQSFLQRWRSFLLKKPGQ